MAKGYYIGVDGVARKVTKQYTGVDGVARKVKRAYVGVSAVARQYWGEEIPIAELPVGSSLFVKLNGVATECIVVHQGKPNTALYDDSCNGTWVLLKNIYTTSKFATSHVNYNSSTIHTYLNNTFYNLLDAAAKAAIKDVKVPYATTSGTVNSLTNGLSTKCFLLSAVEVGIPKSYYTYVDGAKLAYFGAYLNATENAKRVATYNGTATAWWLRSPCNAADTTKTYAAVSSAGSSGSGTTSSNTLGVRPAFVLDSSTTVDPSTMTIV